MEQYFPILKQSELFDRIEDSHLAGMLKCLGAKEHLYQKGETVFAQGESTDSIGILCEGHIRIERFDYDGNRTLVSQVQKGELFGEAFAFGEEESLPFSFTATEDCRVLLLESRRITQTCCNACVFHQQIIFNLLKIIAQKTRELHRRAEITSCRTTKDKLMTYLNLEAQQRNSRKFVIPLDRQELADYLEVDRSGLSAEISKLRKAGVLTCHRSEFELL